MRSSSPGGGLKTHAQRTKVVRVALDRPLEDVDVESRYDEVLLIALLDGAVIGQTFAPAPDGRTLTAGKQMALLEEALGGVIWKRRVEAAAYRALGGRTTGVAAPTVTVVVCTRDRPEQLADCLDSLAALETAPLEVIVVDNCPSDERTRNLCARHDVRYLREDIPGQSRARNRGIAAAEGELVAFTDDDCIVDPRWLDDLGDTFEDPMVAAATGYVGPHAIETPAQRLFEIHGGFQRRYERVVFDGAGVSAARAAGPAGAGANMIFRRSAFDGVGGFAEDLGPGTPASAADDTYMFYRLLCDGRRIVFDPARIVWHQNRETMDQLHRLMLEYGVAVSAFAFRCLVRHRDWDASYVLGWWIWHRIVRDVGRIVFRKWRRVPGRLVVAEAHGTVVGPWRLLRSSRSRRGVEPVAIPPVEQHAADNSADAVSVGVEPPALSVVVPTRDRRELLRRVLEAFARQTHPPDRLEVVVVADRCSDGTAEMARSLDLPYALTLLEKHDDRGLAATRNIGVEIASNPVLVFIDDDIVPGPAFVAAHASAHAAGSSDLVALGPCPPVFDRETYLAPAIRAWWADHVRRKARSDHRWTYVDFVTGNASLSHRLFQEAGGFDDDFSGRHEDWELGVRLLQSGARFEFHPAADARHHTRADLGRHLRGQRAEGAADVLLARKHPRLTPVLPWASQVAYMRRGADSAPYPYRSPRRAAAAFSAGPHVAAALEAAGLRSAWTRLSWKLASNAYWLGVKDLAPDFAELAASEADATNAVRIDLDEPAPVLDAIAEADALELTVTLRNVAVGRVPVFAPHGQWEVSALVQRIVSTLTYEERTDPATAELLRLWKPDPAAAVS